MARGLAPLRHRGFRFLVGGQLASNVGDAFYAVALPWYVLAEHGGPLLLGTVLAAYGVPRTVLLAVGGHASDRWRPWTVMMTSDSVRAVAVAALAVAAASGPARAVVLVPIAAVLGAGEGLFLPGSFAIVPVLLPDEELQSGNALASAVTQLATLAGPAVGGVLVALAGPAPAFAVDAATFAVSALTLAGVRSAQRSAMVTGAGPVAAPVTGPGAEEGSLRSAVEPAGSGARAGGVGGSRAPDLAPGGGNRGDDTGSPTVWKLLRSERILQISLLVTLAANLGSAGADEVALPSLVHGPLRGSAGGYGSLIAAFGAGALLGTLVAAQARQARRPAVLGSLVFLGEALFLAVVPFVGGLITVGTAMAAVGICNGFGNVVMITVFQRWAPPNLLGRLTGLLMLASFGVFPISVALGALVVHNYGPALFFPLAAALLAAAILAGLSQRSWRDFGAADEASPAPSPRRLPAGRRPGAASATTDAAGCTS
jgi:predicted MFS family arabinose efflux permease